MEARDKKLSELGERRVIEELISKYISKPIYGEHLYFPEDVRDVMPIGPRILFSIDGCSINSVRLPWRTLDDVGWSVVTGAISDHVSKGGIPRDIMISIGLPGEYSVGDLADLLSGIDDALKSYRLRLLGGDLNRGSEPWIDVAVIGYTSIKKPPRRCCGDPGDLIVVTGVYGAMGYVSIHGLEESARMNWVVSATRRPRVYVETALAIAASYRQIKASMDTSDSLGYALLELSRLSKRGIALERLPRHYSELNSLCSSEECLWRYVLSGGEEYGSVIIVERDGLERLIDYLNKLRVPHEVIGKVIDRPPHLYVGDRVVDDQVHQWDQFKGWT